ncbi:MAG: hypothetical protein R2939_19845 [Kofleriaceae bacterium]
MNRRAAAPGLALALLVATGACTAPPTRDSCAQVVGGTWTVVGPAEYAGHQWAFVDRGRKIEGYALSRPGATAVDDVIATLPERVVVAPTSLDLARTAEDPATLRGTATRRYTRDATVCKVTTAAALARCAGSTAELTVALPRPPSDDASCAAPEGTPITLSLRQLAEAR